MRVPMVTVGEVLAAQREEDELAIQEILERLPLKDEEGEPPHWSSMTREQLRKEAERVFRAQRQWVQAQRRRR